DVVCSPAATLRPDVVLMDLRMPDTVGVTTTALVPRALPCVRVVVLTTYDTDRDILRAIEAGATGYLLKDTPMETIAEAVRSAANGETVLAPPVAGRLMARMRTPAQVRLTPRETEVLSLVAEGLSNGEIAARLHVGEATVKTHLLRTFSKLNVSDRTAAIAAAVQRGLIAPPWEPR